MAISGWVENTLSPKLSKITGAKFFQAFRNAFFALMPLTIIGSVFMLITDFPIPGYSDFMSGIFGADWTSFITPGYRATLNMLGIFFAGTLSHELAVSYELEDKLSLTILGIVAYVVVAPKVVLTDSGEEVKDVLSFNWLGTRGILTALITSIITVAIFKWCIKKNATIKMPAGVPPMVVNAFAAIVPGVLIISVLLVINGFCMVYAGSLPETIFKFLQTPLQFVVGAPFSVILVAFLNGFLWWLGIHPTVVNSLIYPLLYANSASNQALADAGTLSAVTGSFGCVQMLDQFLTIGGAGMTIGLAISMVFFAKSKRMKAVSKVAIVPACFEISEPMIFSVPLVFEPLMLIPLCLTPILSAIIVILAQMVGFMPMFTNIQAPWATPPILSGFLVAGWQGAVVQIILVALSIAIFLPFTRALDKRFCNEEEAIEVTQ
mgnify:CR=1 FL=1|jgi:PTS system cellobiose-specific IIC component